MFRFKRLRLIFCRSMMVSYFPKQRPDLQVVIQRGIISIALPYRNGFCSKWQGRGTFQRVHDFDLNQTKLGQ